MLTITRSSCRGWTSLGRWLQTDAENCESKTGPNKMILTESNADSSDGINMFLTLWICWWGLPVHSQQGWKGKTIIPAFQSVLGGYVFLWAPCSSAAISYQTQTIFGSKDCQSIHVWAQLGWFSLGGRSNDPQMHLFDLLMDPTYDAEILYLKRLSSAKAVASDYFNHGSALRNLNLITGQKMSFMQEGFSSPLGPWSSKKTMTQG